MSEAGHGNQISDNENHGYIAGRDLFLGDQYVVQETLFFEPDLADVEPPAWTTTPESEDLACILASNHLIVLAGQDLDNKTMVARHLAWLLQKKLPGEVRVREWYRSSDPQKIETAFHEKATTVLLLPQVLPHHIAHRLNELGRLLRTRRNYIVITTEGTRAEWAIRSGSAEETFWHEISWETYYGRTFLTETLLRELRELGTRLPEWLPRELQGDSPLTEGLTVEEAAVRLKQPDRILRFIAWLRTSEASPRGVVAQLDQLGGDQAAIFQWFRQLDRTDQLFALGLVLFDGLPDDQIFAAVEYLVDEAWRRTDPNLPLFDYRDLARLGAYFHLAETGEDGTRIETPSRQKREAILQAAWDLQRRRLLAVVPALTRLLQEISSHNSGRPAEPAPPVKALIPWASRRTSKPVPEAPEMWRFTRGAERELFSSPRRIEQLQRSIIEALSQIGLLSFEAVEASFLELAVDGSSGFQTIVAKALAAWRGEAHSQQLFRILNAWWEDGCIATSARALAQKTVREGEGPKAAMRATVALAVGYALQYDHPNQLAPDMCRLLKELVLDRHPSVRERVLEVTLPFAAASHLRQLEPLLRTQVTQDQDHLYAVAFGTAMAFSLRPSEALEIIEHWYEFCRSQPNVEQGDQAGTPRDRLLSAAALAFGYIRFNQSQDALTPEQVVSRLRSILTTETEPFIRTHALMAMGLQAVDNFDLVSSTLLELISEVTLADRFHVVSVLTRAYLRQREQLEGGEEEIEIGGRTFQVWPHSPRPLTTIEVSLYSWLQDEEHPVAQQVAIQTFAAIAATGLEQKERELASRSVAVLAPPQLPILRIAPNQPRLRKLGFLGRMAVLMAAPRQKETRPLLLPILAEVVEVRRTERLRLFETVAANASGVANRASPDEESARKTSLLPVVLDRWQALEEKSIQSLAHTLRIALDVFRWRWAILLAFLVSCGLLYHDVTEWRRALSRSMLPEDERALLERRAAPSRLAWNLSVLELRQIEELKRREEEEQAARERAEAERLLASQREAFDEVPQPAVFENVAAAMEAPETAQEPEGEEPRPSLTPADRLLRSTLQMLARFPNKEQQWFLLTIEEARRQEARLKAELPSMAVIDPPEEAPVKAEPPKQRPKKEVILATPEPDIAAVQEESPLPVVAEPTSSPALEPAAEPASPTPDKLDSKPKEDREKRPWWKRLRRPRQEKEPPKGEDNGRE